MVGVGTLFVVAGAEQWWPELNSGGRAERWWWEKVEGKKFGGKRVEEGK